MGTVLPPTYEGVLGPEMATATATLDPTIFARYLSMKEHLAGEIQNGLEAVLEIPGLTPDPKQAQARFFQALLNSLGRLHDCFSGGDRR